MVPSELRQIIRHMEWADALVWSAVLPLPPAQADRKLRKLLFHVHLVQWAYVQLWRAEPVDLPDEGAFGDLAALHRWAREGHAQIGSVMATLEAAHLERVIEFPWAQQAGEQFGHIERTNLREAIVQIALHTAHHRGQINTRIRELGGQPPLADFIVWAWAGQPDASWAAGPS